MTKPDFKYDVAFSFLAEDEDLATRIDDAIRDRLTTFIYSEKQKELAGTDGEKTFNRVFGSESRIVFVLYRKGWGETSWTRIEETAIRNRAFEEGFDFVVFARLDKTSPTPKWLPKPQIWVDLDRWGIEGAASVIEERVQHAGGELREETAEDRVDKLSREIEAEKEKKAFLDSFDGVKAANEEIINLFDKLQQATKNNDGIVIECNSRECIIYGEGFRVRLSWELSFGNTLEHSALYLSLWDNRVNVHPFNKPKRLKEIELQFDLSKSRTPTWREAGSSKQSYNTENLAKLALTMLLNKILESKKIKR